MRAADTNVLVYSIDALEPVKQGIAQSLLLGWAADPDEPVLLWQVAVEYLACLRRWEALGRITKAQTIGYLDDIRAMHRIVYPTDSVLDIALGLTDRYSLSYWDSVLVAACLEGGVIELYSEDMQAGANYDGVKIINPFAP